MATAGAIDSDLTYLKQLIGAGLDGIALARRESGRGGFPSTAAMWTPTGIGAALGVLGARFIVRRRSASSAAIAGLVGSAVGLGAAAAWASRSFASAAVRRSSGLVNAVRDAHWLEKNPINYA